MKRIILFIQTLFLLFTCGLYGQPTNGLIARFPMNQVIEDEQNNYDVISFGNLIQVEDRNGNPKCALNFSQGMGLIESGIDFSPAYQKPKTISLWFKLDDIETLDDNIIFTKNDPNDEIGDLTIQITGLFGISVYADPSFLYTNMGGVYIPDLKWHHLVAVIAPYGQYLYIDNELLAVTDYTITGDASYGNVLIGSNFNGSLDDIYFYNRFLTSDEVWELYTAESDCSSIDTASSKKILGNLFHDLNKNNTKEINEPFLGNFDLFFSPTNTAVKTGINGFFQAVLDKNQIHELNLSLDSQSLWQFTVPQNPIDLINYTPKVLDLGNLGVHKRPKKGVLLSATLFSDENGNNVLDGNDYLLTDFELQLNPSNLVLVSDGVGYFEDLLDSGDIQTLEIPINLQVDWTFSIAPDTIDLTDYSGNTYQLGFVGIKPKEKIMVGNLNPNCPSSIAMSRNGACQITLKNIGNVVMKGNFTISLDGPQLITKFIFPSNHTEIELNDSTFLFNFPINGLSSFDSLTANFTLFPQAPPGSKIHIIYAYVDDSGYKIDGNFEITIVAPHDPNYIAVDHEKIYKQFISDQKQLSYTVHFQNLGNAPAENVVIKQVVPQELKNDHIYILGASSPTKLEKVINGNELELIWTFENINLPSFSEDSIGSSGYVSFSMFPEILEKNDSIVMEADIYFDSQPAIQTNEAITSLICKGEVGQNMVDFNSFAALCFGDISGGVLMNANIDTTSMSIIFNNVVQIPYTTDTLHLLAGNYSVSTTDELGCSQNKFVVIKQPSKLNSSIIDLSNDKKELLVGGGTPPYSIMWNNGYSGYELDNLPVGTNIYTITDANGCTLEGLYEKSILKISELSLYQDIKVYPNPVKSLVNIEWKGEDFKAVILDLQGREIKSYGPNNNKVVLDFSELETQVYLLKLTSAKGFNKIIRLIKL